MTSYIPTLAGFLYLAVVLDVWSRRTVGWAMSSRLVTQIVEDALSMAIQQRRPAAGVIFHSDQGCQYTSIAVGKRCRAYGVRPSMGSVGDCYDNAMCESFFAMVECELLDRVRFVDRTEAELAVFDFTEGFYNTGRRHSAIGHLAPAVFEQKAPPIGTGAAPRAVTPSSVVPSRGRKLAAAPTLRHRNSLGDGSPGDVGNPAGVHQDVGNHIMIDSHDHEKVATTI